jgi:Enolase C-terminal domain-like
VKVERVESYHLGRSLWVELWEREKDLVTPLSGYPEYRHPYSTWDPALTLVVLTADDGATGLGWAEDGVAAAKSIIDRPNHAYSLPHVHFSMATPNCPMLEHFPELAWAEPLPAERPLFVGQPVVSGGAVRPPERPGLGITLDRDRLRELVTAG